MEAFNLRNQISSLLLTILLAQSVCLAQTSRKSGDAPDKTNSVSAANPGDVDRAVKLYNDGHYNQARNVLELTLQKKSTAYICYYAALANLRTGNEPRANELFAFIIQTYPNSQEASLARTKAKANASANAKPKIEGVAVAAVEATAEAAGAGATSAKGALEAKGSKEQRRGVSPAAIGQHLFSEADIAKDGFYGVDQSNAPNCWFMSVMAALAVLPRGQNSLANLIRGGRDDSYVVTFNDGTEYSITKNQIRRLTDKALWAKIIEAAEREKFPDNKMDKAAGYAGSVDAAMYLLTGRHSESCQTKDMSEEEIGQFVYGAVKSQNPIVAATRGKDVEGLKAVVVPGHAYSIIDYEPNKHMIVLRNPWGGNPKNLRVDNDPLHLAFEQQKDGIIKLSMSQFRSYFWGMRRCFI